MFAETEETIRPVLILEQIVAKLTSDIVHGRIPPGSRLVETDLQKHYGVSRTPLREAFRELERKGFVEIVPRKGAYVKELSREECINIYQMRSVLEGLAGSLAFSKKPELFTACLEKAIGEMKEAYRFMDAQKFLSAHDDFHDAWIMNCDNPPLTEECRRLRGLTSWHKISLKLADWNFKTSIAAHGNILKCVAKKGAAPKEVDEAIRTNIISAIDRVKGISRQ